jgi:hypothetical protein
MNRLLLLFMFISAFTFAQQNEKKQKTKITVTYTRAYCGGAKPSPEILNELNTARPLSNCVVKLVPVGIKKPKSVTAKTNANGEINVCLKHKTYSIYIASNSKNKAELPFNKKCSKLRTMPLGEFEITDKNASTEIKIPCDPCDPSVKKRQ